MANALLEKDKSPEMSGEIPAELSVKALQVIEAARALFTEHGFGAVSMDQVAKSAGVSKATVYAHFQSKEQLFVAIVRSACRSYADAVMPEVRDAVDIRAALIRVGHAIADFLLAPRTMAVYRIIVAEGPRFPDLARGWYENGPRAFKRLLTNYLIEAIEKGQLKIENPRLAAELFCGMVRGPLYMQVLLNYEDPEVPDAKTVVNGAVEMFLRSFAVTDKE